MIRLIGIVLICTSVIMLTVFQSVRFYKRKAFWQQFCLFLDEAERQIIYLNKNIFSLFDNLNLSQLNFLKNMNKELFENKLKLEQQIVKTGLPLQDREIVLEFILSVGKNDVEGQKSFFKFYREKAELSLAVATTDTADKGKLYRTLGFMCATAVFIILI